jgi:superfamily I DNA and/or RNA helicase
VIDEAGQCHPAYAVSGLLRSRNAWIIGDVHQLEPVIDLEPDDDERLIQTAKLSLRGQRLAPYRVHGQARTSVQSLADRAVRERPRLIDHFRCQPEIIAISNALCDYGLRVHTPSCGPAAPLSFLPEPVMLVDVAGEQERAGGSWFNAAELSLTVELVERLLDAGTDPTDVAVITPYRGQLEALRKQLGRQGVPLEPSLELLDIEESFAAAAVRGVALGTVHRFQGGERSIVLFTSVVTRRTSLGFLNDRENLLNVAVSRARHRLVTLGARAVLDAGARTRLLTRAAVPLSAEDFRAQLGLRL